MIAPDILPLPIKRIGGEREVDIFAMNCLCVWECIWKTRWELLIGIHFRVLRMRIAKGGGILVKKYEVGK
jgi:hypothetical protein